MPIFEINGQKYNVEDQYIDAFSKENPDATTIEDRDGQQYRVRAKDYRSFLTSFDSVPFERGTTIIGGTGTQEEADSLFDLNQRRFQETDPNKRAALEMEYNNLEKRIKEREQKNFRDNLESNGEIKRLQEIQGRAQLAIDKASFFDRFFDADTRAAVAARNQAEEALETYEEANREKKTWFDKNVMGVISGFADKAFDLSTWDLGASGIASGVALNDAVAKMENGEQLSAAEQNMLDAFGLASAVQSAYHDKVGMAYKVGGSLPESMAFGASLAINPLGRVGAKVAETAAKAAVKKYGVSMVSKLAKGAARVGGDVAGMAGVTATTGAGRVVEDYYNRLNGQSTFDIDENGIIRYGGQAEQEEADDAIWKAIGSQFIENYSEAMGNYFAPMGTMLSNLTSKGLKAAHLGKLADVVNDVSSSQFSRGLKRFKEATKFDGLVGEYLEEVAGNVINAATVGDMNFNSPENPRSVFNPETNIETFLSCALMSGTMYAVEAPVSIYNKVVAKRNLNNADKTASELWGDRWNDMRSQMDEADPQLLAQLLTGVQNATDLTDEQKAAAKNYGMRLMQYQGYNARRLQNQAESTDEANEINNAYDRGADMVEPADKHNAKIAMDKAEAALADDSSFLQEVINGQDNPVATITSMVESGKYSDDQIAKAKDYYVAYRRMNGLTDAVLERVNSRVNDANKEVDANTNVDENTGARTIVPVTLRDGRQGYVLKGTVTPGEKGSIDVNKSDSYIVVRVDGKNLPMNPNKDLVSVGQITSPESLKEYNSTQLREQLINEEIGEIDWNPATPNPKIGDSFEMDGIAVTIVDQDGQGGMFVVPTEEWQAAQGSEQKVQQLILQAQQAGSVPASMFKQWASNQLDAQEEAVSVQQEVASGEAVSEQVSSEVNTEANNPETNGENVSPVEVAQQPKMEAQQAPVIPTKEDGSIDFVTYGKEGSFKELGNMYGEKMPHKVEVTAKALAEDVAKAQSDLDKAQEALDNAPIGREAKAKAAFDKAQQEYDAVKRESDFWAEMDADIKAAQARRDEMLNPKVEADMSEEPISADEFVAQQLSNGNIALTSESFKKETGYGEDERKKFIKIIRRSENGGMTIEEAGERLMEMDRENGTNFFDQSDPNAGRDAIINILGMARTWGDIINYIRNNRQRQAEADAEGVRSEMEEAIWNAYHVTPEEYVTMLEMELQENPYEGIDLAALDAIFAEKEFGEEQKSEEYESGTDVEGNQGQSELLSEKRAGNTAGNQPGETVEQTEGFGSGTQAEGETSQAGTSVSRGVNVFAEAKRIDKEEQRRKPLRERAREWSKALGVKVNFIERFEDVKNKTAIRAINEGQQVAGWFELGNGEVYFYMPNLESMDEVDKTYIHEVVSHKGLPQLLGKEKFNELCDKVWDMMPQSARDELMSYPGVNGNKRIAADEYIAYLSESVDLTPEEKTIWDNIVQFFREALDKALDGIIGKSRITNEDIANLIKASYANLKSEAGNVADQIEKAREEVDQNPTEAQKEAGNYKKGHVKIDGYDITIENPKGGVRSGTDKNGKEWSITMNNDYGYIRGTEAVDGDHIDVFLSDNPTEGNVFVVDQSNEDGSFDESKVMYGFNSLEEARAAYLSNYEKGWEIRIMAITEVSKDEFKKWIDSSHRKTKAFSEYKSVKMTPSIEETNVSRMSDIEERLAGIEGERIEIEDQLNELGNSNPIASADLISSLYKLDREQADLESEYSGLRAMNDESNAILEEEGSELRFSAKKKRALETASVSKGKHQPTVVSNADGAKILNNLDNLQKEYEEKSSQSKTFLGDVAKAIEARKQGSGSQYATFETVNGNVVTIRLADHNATVSNFDNRDENEGISIVISAKDNNGITNDGDAHIVEYFYDSIDLRRADGKPLAEIVKSIKQSLYSGEFKDTTGLAERQEVNESRFRVVKDKNGKKSLVGLHNISEEKLRKAVKQGGLANPSMAVIDLDKQAHVDYGDITLIAPADLIDKNTGRSAGTYMGDAWTPTYPKVTMQLDNKGWKKINQYIESIEDNKELHGDMKYGVEDYLDGGRGMYMNYSFLKSKGLNPEIFYKNSDGYVSTEDIKKLLGVEDIDTSFEGYSKLKELPEDTLEELKLWVRTNGNKAKMDEYKKRQEQIKEKFAGKEMPLKFLNQKSDDLGFGEYDRFVYDTKRRERDNGQIDTRKTFSEANYYVAQNGLGTEFDKWMDNLLLDAGAKEVFFAGYTASGNKRYMANTIENVSKFMNKQSKTNAYDETGFGATKALFLKKLNTLEEIREQKDKLVELEEYREITKDLSDRMGDLIGRLSDMQTISSNNFMNYDYAASRLQEAMTKRNPIKHLNDEYGYDLDKKGPFAEELAELIKDIKNSPARYFETKFERPVYLNEFAAAVVPQGTSKDVVDALTDAGLPVEEYEKDNNEARMAAVDKVSAETDGVRFRRVYHGSGASFDRFDHSFMSTGEGNQSYGWGTYVTDVEGIGKKYAGIYAKNSPLAANTLRWMEENGTYEDYLAQGEGKRRNYAIRHAKDFLKELKEDGASEDVIKAYEQDLRDAEDALSEENYNRTKENMIASLNRNLYTVDIPDNNGTNYIEWDKPLSEENKGRIKEAVLNSQIYKDYADKYGEDVSLERLNSWMNAFDTGRVYRLLENFVDNDDSKESAKTISMLLSDAGYVGFEYPANFMSGGNENGEKNYVIFNEHDLDIVEHTRFRAVKDKKLIDKLESEPKIKVYRAMQLIDGNLYPPMSAKVDGKLREPIELGKWEEAEERPDLADEKGYFKLDKGNKTSLKARYNPYIHTSTTPLNDQFSSAQDRPELVTVEVEIPESELTSGYKAEKAKDSVGKLEWKAGVVQGKLSGTRTVILSRWDKPIRIVPDSEVAKEIVKMFGDKKITMPSNVVTPSLRSELEKLGIAFVETDNRGREIGNTRFRISDKGRKIQQEVDKFTSKYNSKEVVLVDSEMTDEELEEAIPYSSAERTREEIFSGYPGGYSPNTDKIYIFVDNQELDDVENTMFHENLHPMFNDTPIVEEYFENAKNVQKAAVDTLSENYGEHEAPNELFAYSVSNDMVDGTFKFVKKYLSDLSKEEFFNKIKEFGYDREKESSRRDLVSKGRGAGRLGTVENDTEPYKSKEGIRQIPDQTPIKGSGLDEGKRSANSGPETVLEEGIRGIRERAERLGDLFEQVADMGLDGVLGNKAYEKLLMDIYNEIPEKDRSTIDSDADSRYNGNPLPAVSDYINHAEPTIIDRIASIIREALRRVGFDVELSFNDVKYMLWRSRKRLNRNNVLDVAEDIDALRRFGTSDNTTRFSIKKKKESFDVSDKRDKLLKEYDAFLKTGKFNFIEAFQDRMYSLKVLMDKVVEATGKKVRDYEDAYKAENQLGSINKPMQEKYLKNFYKPLLEAVKELSDKYGREAVERYIYCKSGLERNVVLRQRDADEAYNSAKAELDEKLAKNEIDQAQYSILLQQAENQRNKTLSEDVDYSGIRGMLFNSKAQDIQKEYEDGKIDKSTRDARLNNLEANRSTATKDWKKFAESQVAFLEGKAFDSELDALWDRINAATNETLRMDYESGMIDKETYDAEMNMMKYYVPLRNWDDTTAEEMYEYRSDLVRPVSSNQKRAKGRESQADNPIVTIGLMAQSAIVRGNRNKVKQKFYAFVANRETSLATVRDVWYVKDPSTGGWVPQYADTSSAKNSSEFDAIIAQFEEDMKLLEEQGQAFRGKLPFGMKFKASASQKKAHVVPVMINGIEYAVYVNGNPRAAQAINGETNNESVKNTSEWIDKLKRLYGAGLTSWNPDFIIPNLVRDTIHASTMTMLDSGPIAAIRYMFNTPKMFWNVGKMVTGLGNADPKLEAYFKEFVDNGGETGYTAINILEDYKKEYEKLIDEAKGIKASAGKNVKKTFGAMAKILEAANRIAEDVNRFNAYVSARESGESIMRSVDAAKNITVNFNRKGALSANDSVFGTVANAMNKWILFFNPAVQGIAQIVTKSKMNPKRAASMGATILASGFMMPMLNEMLVAVAGGDEEDDYWNQSDYKRRNNWMLFTGDGYMTFPLPPILRELYGIGDVIYGTITGHITAERAAMDIARQVQSAVGFFNLIPEVSQEPDMVTYAKGFAPDIAAPILDVISNTNFMGRPIAKWTDYNKYDPEYERVYKGTSKHWVELSMLLNEAGGNEGKRSDLWGNFINPAMMEHLITSYGGGIGKTINNLVGMALADGEDNVDPFRKTPIIPRFYTPNDEKTVVPGINRKYYDYNYKYNVAKKALKNYQEGISSGEHPEWQKYIDEMKRNKEVEFINYFKEMDKRLKKLQNLLKGNPTNKESLEEQIVDLKAKVSAESWEILK